jgi:integrase/recombinase XerC
MPTIPIEQTVSEVIASYLETIRQARSPHTAATYKNALNALTRTLAEHDHDSSKMKIGELREDAISWLASSLKSYAPTTEALYLTATSGFFEYLVAENLSSVNMHRLRLLVRQRSRRPGVRLPQFPRDSIDEILEKILELKSQATEDEMEYLRNLRDCAFLITLADTGLRVHEACNLRRGDIDWNEGKAVIIGKGNREAVVRFSNRCLTALKEYLSARARIDGSSGRSLSSLPLFARHDRGAGKNTKPITTTTGRNIVAMRVREFLGAEAVGTITPHSFRHYFVTRILRSTGNLKLAQELARHKSIAVTQRYTHLSDDELDHGYWTAIEE